MLSTIVSQSISQTHDDEHRTVCKALGIVTGTASSLCFPQPLVVVHVCACPHILWA